MNVFFSALDAILAELGKRPNVFVFHSSGEMKSNEFFPVVDAVVSYSSTLGTISSEMGIPTYMGIRHEKLEGFSSFLASLDPSSRAARVTQLRASAEEALSRWTDLLSSGGLESMNVNPSCHAVFSDSVSR